MGESTTPAGARHFSSCASLAALGVYLQHLDLFGPVRTLVHIEQKTVKHAPGDKLYDAFIALLAGAHGLGEINTRLRSDPALQAAFGRTCCAEQSVVQDTLDACTTATVAQLEAALATIYRQHGAGYRHDYGAAWPLLDADMSGLPCGPKAALATKGYFAKQRNRRGRQLGRVVATPYEEIVVDQVFSGTTQLATALPALITAAAQTLELDEAKRRRTIIRIDAGGGSLDDINWLLRQGYQVHGKDYSPARAALLARSVTEWVADPKVPGRQVGWVTVAPAEYVVPVRRIAVRCPKKNGQWGVGVVLSTLPPQEMLRLTGREETPLDDAAAVLLAYVSFYDARGGGVETNLKGDKQGVGLTRRNKKRFPAQQMVVLLSALAHNVLVWARTWLAPQLPQLNGYGILRLVRDVFHVSGFLEWDPHGHLVLLVLNRAAPLASGLTRALHVLLAPQHVAVSSGET